MSRPRVLIVDDKESMRGLLLRILGEAYEVSEASDVPTALAAARAEHFDVVLSDIRMPGADGFELLAAIKAEAPRTEVILMTAYASIERAVEAIKLGAFDYLAKPFEPDDAALVVARALAKRAPTPRSEGGDAEHADPAALASLPYREAVERAREQASRQYLIALMRQHRGNVTRAAERAGVERESLHRLLRKHGVRSEDFK